MSRRFLIGLLAALALAVPAVAAAETASLIADRITIDAEQKLVAEGNVEVLYRGARLRASRVSYDRTGERLAIDGPIALNDGEGAIVVADAADLSADLRDGILRSARVVLDQQLQLAAAEVNRVQGRYTRLSRTVASSCRVCADAPTPLWEIRARRVVHDQEERQIYFESAQLRFGGVPVFWLPYLRMPDPTLDRASGFLMPQLTSNSALGVGLQVPYFIRMGDHRDLTLIPQVTTKDVYSLGFRYRQAFRRGEIAFVGALSHDNIIPGRRGWLTAAGRFDLPRGFTLEFDAETVSDRAYLTDYGLSDQDRLDSRIEISRTRRDEHISARLVHFHSIREGEVNAFLPSIVADLRIERRFDMPGIGGVAGIALVGHARYRSSSLDVLGRDVARAGLRADWSRNWVLPAGVLGSLSAEVTGDLYRIGQDSGYRGHVRRVTPAVAAELRWPLLRDAGGGVTHMLEPVAQLAWSRRHPQDQLPNEDSLLLEFDEGNLFSFNRYPGADRREGGARLNLGLGWTRIAPTGWTLGVMAGRILRARDEGQFTRASGLGGKRSDWLAAVQVQGRDGLGLLGRAVFDDDLTLARGEVRLRLDRADYGFSSGWVWARADLAEDRLTDTSEWVVDARYRLSQSWTAMVAARHDFTAEQTTAAALGLQFANECLRLDLSLSRRFTSSTSVRPSTDFGLSVDLVGFGGSGAAGPAGRTCRR